MRFHAFLLLAAPFACFAQVPGTVTAPPAAQIPAGPKASPEVDQALRARANAFLGYESKGDFRKAYDLVAEDSKDYYFGATKEKSASFTIDDIQYGADLTTATVKSMMKRQTMLAGHSIEVPQLLLSQWKLEKGEWVWYHDPAKDVVKTILGDQPAPPVAATSDSPIPSDVSQKAAVEAARKIAIPRPSIDKKVATFVLGKEATQEVTYHNSTNGQVRVFAEVRGVRDTITVEPNDVMVAPQADVPFKITYKPHPESSLRGGVLFSVEPFGSAIGLPVRFLREGQVLKPATSAAPAGGNPAGANPAAPAPASPTPANPAPASPAPAPVVR
jgi:hypothetical protein